jgi:putative ABC transport system permease protein
VGHGLGILAVRVLGLLFNLAPPTVTLPIGPMIALGLFVVITSAMAMGAALVAVDRVRPADVLREL